MGIKLIALLHIAILRALAGSISSPRGKKAVEMPHELVLKYLFSKTNFIFNLAQLTLFRERYPVTTPSNFFLKEPKGKTVSCKYLKPCKNRKNARVYYPRTRDKFGSNSPPFHGNVQIPPSPGTMHGQIPGIWPPRGSH